MAGHSPSGFSDRVQNSWFHQLWQVVQVLNLQSTPRPSHHVWLLVWCSFYEILCWFYSRCKHRPSKKFNFCLIIPQNICPKVLGIILGIFFGKCETRLCVLFGQQWLLPWNFLIDAVFAQRLSYCWIMNTDFNWGKWGLRFFRCCSGFFYDLLDESLLRSWSNFGRPATPGKVHHCSKFLHLWILALTMVRWSPKALEMALYPFPDWYILNYFVSHLFLNFFRSQHDVLLFKHASLCQTGLI